MDKNKTDYEYELIKTIRMYEEAHKRAMELLKLGSGPVCLTHPLCDSLKYYKRRIKELREALRSTNV